ncbi:MAG: DNA polymerase III subunit gamma/tau [Candidatus Microsaccharimonas sp.]
MSQALYRKYRSKSLAEVIGQRHITDILGKAIEAGRISHAYLLTGPKGVGKTSVARILAHEINNLPYSDDSTYLDIIEIDAASNNGVEDVRDLRQKVQIAPVSAAKKVYIIDEVHMLSKAAFNALLKTLEEPPEHIVFILATTDVDKLPATIISRTQRFGFRAITEQDAIAHLRHIATEEKIKIDDEALALIAQRGDGSFRDSISLLDQLASLADDKQGITTELVGITLGLAPTSIIENLLKAIESHDVSAVATILKDTSADGISAATLAEQLTFAIRSLIGEKPQLLPLLDALLDVAKSSQPELKLLSVLGTAAMENKPVKSVALATPVLEVTATIEELTKQATKVKPSMAIPIAESAAAVTSPEETKSEVQKAERSSPLKRSLQENVTADAAKTMKDPSAFDFAAMIAYTKEHYVALYSVLAKCSHELENSKLTLYTVNKFYKKKLDDPKYSSHLYESLSELGFQLTIHTIPTHPTPKSSQAASIVAMMGGGEEVVVDAA